MALLIRNYSGEPKLAVVRTDREYDTGHETLYIGGDTVELLSSGFCADKGEASEELLAELHAGDIVTVGRHGLIYKMYDSADRDATVYMTGKCNSNCIMCPESDNERRFDDGIDPVWMREYIELLPPELEHIVITGGEPTLNTGLFFEVMCKLKEKYDNRDILLLTNGRSFASKSMVERLSACRPGLLTAAVPLHGHTAELHDSISRASGSFRQSCLGVGNLKSIGALIEIRVVVSKLNCQYLSNIADFISEMFPYADIVNFVGLEVMGNCAKNRADVYIDYVDAFPYVKPAIHRLLASGIDAALYNFPLCAVEPGFWPLCKKSITPSKIRFAEACCECDAKSLCGGVFHSTLALARPQLTPIHFTN